MSRGRGIGRLARILGASWIRPAGDGPRARAARHACFRLLSSSLLVVATGLVVITVGGTDLTFVRVVQIGGLTTTSILAALVFLVRRP